MRNEFGQRPLERAFTEQDEFGKAFLFHRSHAPLREGIQIWAARREAETPDIIEHEGLETQIVGIEMISLKCGERIRSQNHAPAPFCETNS